MLRNSHQQIINYLISKVYYSEAGQKRLSELNKYIKKYAYFRDKTIHLDQLLRVILVDLLLEENIDFKMDNDQDRPLHLMDELMNEDELFPSMFLTMPPFERWIAFKKIDDEIKYIIAVSHRLSSQGAAGSSYALSKLYLRGAVDNPLISHGRIPVDVKTAVHFLELSFSQGHVQAGIALANIYRRQDHHHSNDFLSNLDENVRQELFTYLPHSLVNAVAVLRKIIEIGKEEMTFTGEESAQHEQYLFQLRKAYCAHELAMIYRTQVELGGFDYRRECMLQYYAIAAQCGDVKANTEMAMCYLLGDEQMQLSVDRKKADELLCHYNQAKDLAEIRFTIANCVYFQPEQSQMVLEFYLFWIFASIYKICNTSFNGHYAFMPDKDTQPFKELIYLLKEGQHFSRTSLWSAQSNPSLAKKWKMVLAITESYDLTQYEREWQCIKLCNTLLVETYHHYQLSCPFIIPQQNVKPRIFFYNFLFSVGFSFEHQASKNHQVTVDNNKECVPHELEAVYFSEAEKHSGRPYHVLSLLEFAKIEASLFHKTIPTDKDAANSDRIIDKANYVASKITDMREKSLLACYLHWLFKAMEENDGELAASHLAYLLQTGLPYFPFNNNKCQYCAATNTDLSMRWDEIRLIVGKNSQFANALDQIGRNTYRQLVLDIYEHFQLPCTIYISMEEVLDEQKFSNHDVGSVTDFSIFNQSKVSKLIKRFERSSTPVSLPKDKSDGQDVQRGYIQPGFSK